MESGKIPANLADSKLGPHGELCHGFIRDRHQVEQDYFYSMR